MVWEIDVQLLQSSRSNNATVTKISRCIGSYLNAIFDCYVLAIACLKEKKYLNFCVVSTVIIF